MSNTTKDSCASCRFSGQKFNYNDHKCLRRAPTMDKVESWQDIRGYIPVWPIVHSDQWCGEFEGKPKERMSFGDRMRALKRPEYPKRGWW